MPSIAREQKDFYKAKIRCLIPVDHGISRLEIQQRLDKDGLHLDRHHVGKPYDEIIIERTNRPDPGRTDKPPRLQVVAPYIKNGTVLFPRSGCEQL